jgi:hypothetical protein
MTDRRTVSSSSHDQGSVPHPRSSAYHGDSEFVGRSLACQRALPGSEGDLLVLPPSTGERGKEFAPEVCAVSELTQALLNLGWSRMCSYAFVVEAQRRILERLLCTPSPMCHQGGGCENIGGTQASSLFREVGCQELKSALARWKAP